MNSRLTQDLAALGIPNPFAELGLTRAENFQLFGRHYLGNMVVSDLVTTPEGQALYERCADGDLATVLTFDPTGDRVHRPVPAKDRIYAMVYSPTHSLFWQRLESAIDLRVDSRSFFFGDSFVATYGLPDGNVEAPDN